MERVYDTRLNDAVAEIFVQGCATASARRSKMRGAAATSKLLFVASHKTPNRRIARYWTRALFVVVVVLLLLLVTPPVVAAKEVAQLIIISWYDAILTGTASTAHSKIAKPVCTCRHDDDKVDDDEEEEEEDNKCSTSGKATCVKAAAPKCCKKEPTRLSAKTKSSSSIPPSSSIPSVTKVAGSVIHSVTSSSAAFVSSIIRWAQTGNTWVAILEAVSPDITRRLISPTDTKEDKTSMAAKRSSVLLVLPLPVPVLVILVSPTKAKHIWIVASNKCGVAASNDGQVTAASANCWREDVTIAVAAVEQPLLLLLLLLLSNHGMIPVCTHVVPKTAAAELVSTTRSSRSRSVLLLRMYSTLVTVVAMAELHRSSVQTPILVCIWSVFVLLCCCCCCCCCMYCTKRFGIDGTAYRVKATGARSANCDKTLMEAVSILLASLLLVPLSTMEARINCIVVASTPSSSGFVLCSGCCLFCSIVNKLKQAQTSAKQCPRWVRVVVLLPWCWKICNNGGTSCCNRVRSVSFKISRRNKTAARCLVLCCCCCCCCCCGSLVVVVVLLRCCSWPNNPWIRSVTVIAWNTVSAWERIPPSGDNKASNRLDDIIVGMSFTTVLFGT